MTEQQKGEIARQILTVAEAAFLGVDATYRGECEDARQQFRVVLDEMMRLAAQINVDDHVRDVDDRL